MPVAALNDELRSLSSKPVKSTEIPPNESRVLITNITFSDKKNIPSSLQHIVHLVGPTGPSGDKIDTQSYHALEVPVSPTRITIQSPLKGTRWAALNGISNDHFAMVHTSSLVPVNGRLVGAQLYAIDWLRLDEEGRFYSGDGSKVQDWYGYDEPVYAVADGEVVSLIEDLDDQPPRAMPDRDKINIDNFTGNHIILKLREGVYAFYAHLRKGSIKLKLHEKVKAG